MSKRRRPWLDWLVYLAVRVAVAVVQALPVTWGCTAARGLAWLAFHLDRRHRQVARDNLSRAFPGRFSEPGSLDAMVHAVYRHFCTMVVEMVHLPRKLRPNTWQQFIDLGREVDPLVRLLLSGRPVLIVTGHFGNWEMAGYALAMFGFKSFAVARPLDNPYLEQLLRDFRRRTGQELLAKKGELDRMEGILAGGGIVCTLADQDAGQNGLFIDFFGVPASTHKAVALLAMQHRAVMVVAGAYRLRRPLSYRLHVADIIDPVAYADDPHAVRQLTERFTQGLEAMIRLAPDQYFWLHRRWKHQPKPRAKRAA